MGRGFKGNCESGEGRDGDNDGEEREGLRREHSGGNAGTALDFARPIGLSDFVGSELNGQREADICIPTEVVL